MSRAVAAVLVWGMAIAPVSARVSHVHVYGGHAHADHEHGPAFHRHDADAHDHDPDGLPDGRRLEPCDPGAHAMATHLACGLTTVSPAPAPVASVARVLAPPLTAHRASTPRDVRAHSPPRLTGAPRRAPPLVRPA